MIIVLEGPDGSGKSTLAEALYRRLSATAMRQGPPPRGLAYSTFKAMIDFAGSTPANVVIDRLHWGAWPYGNVYRGGSELSIEQILDLDTQLGEMGALLVYVRADAAVLDQRIIDRGEERSEFEVASLMPDVVRYYDEIWAAAEALSNEGRGVALFLLDANEFGDTEQQVDLLIAAAADAWEEAR